MADCNSETGRLRHRLHLHFVGGIVATALAVFVLLVTNGLPSGSVREPAPVTLLAILLASLTTLYPAVRNLLNGSDLLEPSVILGGLLFGYFPLRAFAIAVLNFTPRFPSFRAAADRTLPALTVAILAVAAGAAAFYVGYRFTRRRRSTAIWPAIGTRRLLVANVTALWLLSVGLHLLGSMGYVASSNAVIGHLTDWHYLALLVLLAGYFRSDGVGVSRVLLLFVFTIEVAVVTVVGFDLNSLLALLTFAVIAYHYLGPGVTARKLAAIDGLVVVLFPVSEIAENLQTGQPIREAFVPSGKGFAWYLDGFLGRMIGADALTMIVERTPDPVPFQHGETLLLAVYGLVPRAIWPEKPSIIMCGVNNVHFSGRGAAANTCAAMTVPGELYWNFGALGVVAGLFAIGLLLGGLYRWFRFGNGGPSNYVLLFVFALTLLPVMRFESGFGQLVSNLVKDLAFGVVFLWFATEPEGPRSVHLDGDSALARSRTFRLARAVGARLRRSPLGRTRAARWVRTRIRNTPETVERTVRTSETYRALVALDRFLERQWRRVVDGIRRSWHESGIRTIVRNLGS